MQNFTYYSALSYQGARIEKMTNNLLRLNANSLSPALREGSIASSDFNPSTSRREGRGETD